MSSLRGTGKFVPYDQRLKSRSRSLRNEMTKAEKKLWYTYLRKHPLNFTRQKPIDHFIVDFYCPGVKLVIEVDGDSHFFKEGIVYDTERSNILRSYGLEVLRFTNQEISQDMEKVIEKVEAVIRERVA